MIAKIPLQPHGKKGLTFFARPCQRKILPSPPDTQFVLLATGPLVPFLQAAVAYKTLHRSMTTRDIPINCSYG